MFLQSKKKYKLSITLFFIFIYPSYLYIFYSDYTLLHKVFSQNNIEMVKQHQINGKKNITEFEENSTLSNVFNSQLRTEYKNIDNWITINHDIYATRHSNQTIINKDNVANLQIKWILFANAEIQEPPIIIGNTGYVQDHSGNIISFDIKNGKIIWKVHIGTGPTMGLTFSNGVIFASTGFNSSALH